jgi:creatinine amidohydrolase/Fe(II)-dependent formamide hydrolase-like protein
VAQDPGQVREAIEQDRAALAETVEALVHKADVKERVRGSISDKAGELQHRAGGVAGQVRQLTPEKARSGLASAVDSVRRRPVPLVVAGVIVLGLLIRRRAAGRK